MIEILVVFVIGIVLGRVSRRMPRTVVLDDLTVLGALRRSR